MSGVSHISCDFSTDGFDLNAYLESLSRVPALSPDEERQLGWSIVNDNCAESRERLTRANMPLVVRIARQYANRGLTMEELMAHGAKGLVAAVNDYDPANGMRFSTWASWWIKESIRRSLPHMHAPAAACA